jgi:hypothetical protein
VFFGFKGADPTEEGILTRWRMARTDLFWRIEQLIDHYIHISGTTEFKEDVFKGLYCLWEASILKEKLSFDIIVPLLYLKFDFDQLDFGDFTIEKMSDDVQLRRNTEKSYNVAAHETVIGAATHALVLKNWHIDNPGLWKHVTLANAEAFVEPLKKVEILFASIRAVCGCDTGYSQVVIRPDGWADRWVAQLPEVYVFSVRAYPDRFENYGWLEEPPVLTQDQCNIVGRVSQEIEKAQKNKLILAARRLNAASLRKDEEDAILDVTIGLETLLTDDSHGEITYRLAIRLAALCKLRPFESQSPSQIFALGKRLYDFRSAVVHGSAKASTKRIVQLSADRSIPTVTLGISLLRHLVVLLSDMPEYLEVKKIDKDLLEGL